jgi:hypothetical protein
MGDLERSRVAPSQADERRWVVASGLGAHLSERRQPGGDGKRGTAEKVATIDLLETHVRNFTAR